MEKKFIGLVNEGSDLSCYLNTAVQVFFHMRIFNEVLCFKTSEESKHECVASALQNILSEYDRELTGKQNDLITVNLQLQLAEVWGQELFGMNRMADTMEVLNCLMISIHHAYKGNCFSNETFEDLPCDCVIHQKFAMEFENCRKCEKCGIVGKSCSLMMNQPFNAFEYLGDIQSLKLKNNSGSEAFDDSNLPFCINHMDQFPRYFKAQVLGVDRQTCDQCSLPFVNEKRLKNLPDFIIFQVIWKDRQYSKLSTLELMVSLKLSINIREIFDTELDENYNIKGFIMNAPLHYYYVGRVENIWWEVNDSNVRKLEDFNRVLSSISQKHIKIVGIIFEKNEEIYYENIRFGYIKRIESMICNSLSCPNCNSLKEKTKCETCGYNENNKKWNCPKCFKHNIDLKCKRCETRMIEYDVKCNICNNFSKQCNCHIYTCKICLKVIDNDKYCGGCNDFINIFSYLSDKCKKCGSDTRDNLICYFCSTKKWNCLKCGQIQSHPFRCLNCKTIKTGKLWYCDTCLKYNDQNEPCEDCGKSEDPKDYCNICCTEKFIKCKCGLNINCVLCSTPIINIKDLICFRCGNQVFNNFCQVCMDFVPKLYFPCKKCFHLKADELTGVVSRVKANQCVICKLEIEDSIFLCWVCGSNFAGERTCECNPDEVICESCLVELKYCKDCERFYYGNQCFECGRVEVSLIEKEHFHLQIYDSDWQCFKCNSFNRLQVYFCEGCNYPKESSFIESYKCKFCTKTSIYQDCIDCLWTVRCSCCQKRIYFTQTHSCGECGSKLINSYCRYCDMIVPRNRILCLVCSGSMRICNCGRKRHPMSMVCFICRLKVKFSKLKCYYCKTLKFLDICYYCSKEISTETCPHCNLINSEKNFYYCLTCKTLSNKKDSRSDTERFSHYDLD